LINKNINYIANSLQFKGNFKQIEELRSVLPQLM